jgi:hypothetical protein
MLSAGVQTLAKDERGLRALHLLPGPASRGDWVLLRASQLQWCDTWTATAIKTAVELHCTVLGNDFDFDPPVGANGRRTMERLCDLLGPMPSRFRVMEGNLSPGNRRSALLPALPIRDPVDADNAADTTWFRASAYGRPISGLVAAAVSALAENTFVHGAGSATGVVMTVGVVPASREIQIVSSDLGAIAVPPEEAEVRLVKTLQASRSSHTSLAHLVEIAGKRSIPVSLTLASGPGRVRWDGSGMISETTFAIPGFTSALTLSTD